MADRVVGVLGRGVVPADTPILRADDLGVLRGDGVFETLHIRDGRPWLFDEHLTRMAGSAARLDMELPPLEGIAGLAAEVCAQWPVEQEGALRLVCTRGLEGGGPVTFFATLSPIQAAAVRARAVGVTVVTATLGYAAAARTDAPWLLGGVKSLSYAVNLASQRWAAEQGADDLLWVSADGWALEAPTSSLVWLDGEQLCTVPAESTGILRGCTAGWLLDHAAELGFTATHRMVRPAELTAAGGAWLTSSVRGLVELRAVDGMTLPASPHTAHIRALLGFVA